MSYEFPLRPEEDISNFELSGNCTVWETDPENATCIIRTSQEWGVTFNWRTSGWMAASLGGAWTVWVYLEKLGPEEGPDTRSADEPYVPEVHIHEYTETIRFRPRDVGVGLYILKTAVTMKGPGGVPTPIAMLGEEGPLIQVYEVPD